jgi:hypothetical protein
MNTLINVVAPRDAVRREARRLPLWAVWVTWIAILAPLPYSLSRLLWAAGIPFGISEPLLDDLEAPGWGSLYIAILALLAEGTAIFTHVFVRSRARRVPGWIPVLRGRQVRPLMVISPLLLPIGILTVAYVELVRVMLDGFEIPADIAGLRAWSFWGQAAVFMAWGTALTIATFAYWHATRNWQGAREPTTRAADA